MATTKRAATRATKSAGRTSAQRGATTAAKTRATGAKKPAKAAKKAAAKKRAPVKAAKKSAAPKATASAAATAALAKKLKAGFARERAQLEQRLTETVREIGVLRHHEMRAMQLERQLAERDATIATLRRELEAQAGQPAAPPPDTQPGLNFSGGRAAGLDDLDETAALDDEDDLL